MPDTLLLADDSVTMQRVVELTFAEQGLKVVSVSDGHQAIDYLTRHRPAAALVSMTLPRVGGFDIARYVRDHAAEPRLPVLLLAGAFDAIDDAQVRESGAAGVLVKPFEPAVVIKRVKDLLGMSKAETSTRPVAERPPGSGRLVTSSEPPARDSGSHSIAVAPDGLPSAKAPDVVPAVAHDAPREPGAPRDAKLDSWEKLREEIGAGAGASASGAADSSGDYLQQLDAAFETLDAQLAGRTGPPGRGTSPSIPHLPAALDPARRPVAPSQARVDVPAVAPSVDDPAGANPVFEVDDNWFDQKPKPADIDDLTEFVVTRAGDYATPSASGESKGDQDRSWIPGGSDVSGSSTTDSSYSATAGVSQVGSSSAGAPRISAASNHFAAPGSPDSRPASGVRDAISAAAAAIVSNAAETGRDADAAAESRPGSTFASPPAIDAFAAMLTGGRTGADEPAGPIDLSESTVAALATSVSRGLAGAVADHVGESLAERVTAGLVQRVTGGVADQLAAQLPGPVAAGVSERVAVGVGERVTAGIVGQVTAGVAEHVTARVVDPLAVRLADQLTTNVGDRVASALGDRLTQALSDRLVADLPSRVIEGVVEAAAPIVAERMAPAVADLVSAALAERLSAGLAEQLAERVAERVMREALGDALRQTVNEVAERVVRAEVERLRAAAASLRPQ